MSNKKLKIYNYDLDNKNIVILFKENNTEGRLEISSDTYILLDFTIFCKIGNGSDGKLDIDISSIHINYEIDSKIIVLSNDSDIPMINISSDNLCRLRVKYYSNDFNKTWTY